MVSRPFTRYPHLANFPSLQSASINTELPIRNLPPSVSQCENGLALLIFFYDHTSSKVKEFNDFKQIPALYTKRKMAELKKVS